MTNISTRLLSEVEAKDWLKQAGIAVVETKLAKTKAQALALGREMGFPLALKIVSPDISHKSDVGGVILDLKNPTQLGRAYSGMLASIREKLPQARIEGVSVQRMAPPGVEIIIGMSQDSQFGPVLMFGLGGILVEVLKDVSFRIVPLAPRDAAEMVREIKGFALLTGYRGHEAVSLPELEGCLLKVSQFIEANPQIRELDLNPVLAYKDRVLAVDARIVVEEAVAG
jgi:acyl-CoA synthetase (NDP forming)